MFDFRFYRSLLFLCLFENGILFIKGSLSLCQFQSAGLVADSLPGIGDTHTSLILRIVVCHNKRSLRA